MIRSHRIVTLFLFISTFSYAFASDFVHVRTYPTHSRMTFRIDDSVSTELKNTKTGFELHLRGSNLADLGAASGEGERWKAGYRKLNDMRLDSIEVSEIQGEIVIQGRWKFPTGPLALANAKMELFDYRDKFPPQYIIDFWVKEGPTIRQQEMKQKQEAYLMERKKVSEFTEKNQARRLASIKEEEAFQSSMRVCETPMSTENDIFLKFSTIHQKVDFSRWISITTPDAKFSYYRTGKKTRDAKYVRLALDLYKRGNWGLVVRTLDFLDKEYPRSDYQTEMKFLRANAYLRMGMEQQAITILKKIIGEYNKGEKGSSVALYAAMFLAGRFLDSHLTLAAMENFLWLIQTYPDYGDVWIFHLGLAECLYALKQTERASKEYQWVKDNAPNEKARAEGAFRAGDLYMARYQYEAAIATYASALRDFKNEAALFPDFFLNRGEALYQVGQIEIAKQVFRESVELYAGHPGGWRATLRLGEIVANGTLDPEKIKESRDWFYETINRYPASPGATLARLRLLPCGDHGGMDMFASEQFFTNIAAKFDGGGEVIMTNYEDFRALAHIRALVTLGPEEEIGKVAFKDLQRVKDPLARKKIILVATESVQRKIIRLIADGKHYEALSFYTAMSPLISKDTESERLDYLLALSQSASNLGLGTFGEKLSKIYQEKLLRLKQRPNRAIAQALKSDGLDVEIKRAEEEFSAAKAAWISDSKSQASLEFVKEKLKNVKEESKFFYEKEIILGLIEEKQGNLKASLAHVANAHLQKSSARVTAWLAYLTLKADDSKDALKIFKEVENQILESKDHKIPDEPIESNLGIPPVPPLTVVIISEGEILETMKKWGEASAKYSQAIDIGLGGNQLAFQYARSLIKTGDVAGREKAMAVLEKLSVSEAKDEKEKFWKRMAQATLAGERNKEIVN
ncbi:MAG: tetratricopeptide repeat protein [Bdellovibrionia bacterium]